MLTAQQINRILSTIEGMVMRDTDHQYGICDHIYKAFTICEPDIKYAEEVRLNALFAMGLHENLTFCLMVKLGIEDIHSVYRYKWAMSPEGHKKRIEYLKSKRKQE